MSTYYVKDIKVDKIETFNKWTTEVFVLETKNVKHFFRKDEIISGYKWTSRFDVICDKFITKAKCLKQLEELKSNGMLIEVKNDGTITASIKPRVKVYFSNNDCVYKNFDSEQEMKEYIDKTYPELRKVD